MINCNKCYTPPKCELLFTLLFCSSTLMKKIKKIKEDEEEEDNDVDDDDE